MRPRKRDDGDGFLAAYLDERMSGQTTKAMLDALMMEPKIEMAETERREAAKRATLWGCGYDLVTDGIVEMVPYADPADVTPNDLVIITRGENAGHVAIVEEAVHTPSHARRSPQFALNTPPGHAKLRRVWPVHWRGPASSYWAPETVFDAIAQLCPKVPEFSCTGEAEWWMHDARKVAVGQEAAFTITVRTYLDEKPWRDQYDVNEYVGTITEIAEFDMPYWYRYRPLAKGKFRVLHFDDDMNPSLTWTEEIVRL